MDVPYYDKELLDRIAEESGFCKDMMEDAEKKGEEQLSLQFDLGDRELRRQVLRAFRSTRGFSWLSSTRSRKIADEGSCVIVGRCADYILRGIPEATNVFIYAEEQDKIKRAVEEYGVPAGYGEEDDEGH